MATFASTEHGAGPIRQPPPAGSPLPVGFTLVADRDLRILSDGRVLVGGSPARLMRLRPRAAAMVQRWRAGEPIADRRADRAVARRLVSAGMLHPRPPSVAPGVLVTVVVPVRDRPELLASLLRSLGKTACVVVDDCSLRRDAIEKVARDAGAEYVRLEVHSGPAAARNAGLARVRSPLVVFLDSDCSVPADWLDGLIGHFGDTRVALVAPRVVTPSGPSWLARYEATCSPLDLGADEGRVGPATRVSYVPSAAMVVRRSAIAGRCFDERLQAGEDVDLVWRLVAGGWDVRYVPAVEVTHASDVRPSAWLGRRALYGSTAGPLARRHGDALAPARMSAMTAATWGLVGARRPVAAVAVGATATAVLASRLTGVVDDPFAVASRLTATSAVRSARPAVAGLARAWAPALGLYAWLGHQRKLRQMAVGALVVSATRDWSRRPSELDPARYLIARFVDDLAYGSGLWWGCWRARTIRPLIPAVAPIRPRLKQRTVSWSRPPAHG